MFRRFKVIGVIFQTGDAEEKARSARAMRDNLDAPPPQALEARIDQRLP
jgi:hypothetical protein